MKEIYHGNTNNQNAAKAEPRVRSISIRVTAEYHEALKEKAKSSKISLTNYVLRALKEYEK